MPGRRWREDWAVPGLLALGLLLGVGAAATTCGPGKVQPPGGGPATSNGPATLAEARKGFVTKTHDVGMNLGPASVPPPAAFTLVHYPAPPGALAAYVSPRPADGVRHPAIVWIIGGFGSSIGDTAWLDASPDNDQSARAFRDAGIVLMLPSLRGGNDNPGHRESFYGEVDDVVAAGEFVRQLDYVDPDRVYLGGHSTGGTLALLVVESSQRFRAVFAFGPASSVTGYPADELAFDRSDAREVRVRSPVYFTAGIQTPTWAIEGAEPPSNASALRVLAKGAPTSLRLLVVPAHNHFSLLAPATAVIAQKILADTGPASSIQLTREELAGE